MTKASKQKKSWLVPMLLLIVVAGSWFAYRAVLPPFTPPTLPVPNGYDDLLQAATMLAPRTGFYDEMEADELAAVVNQNLPAIELARNALQKECMVVVNWSADATGLDAHLEQLQSIRSVARAFAAMATYAKSLGRTDQAVACGFDLLVLAPAAARGGLVVDRQVARAIEGMALQVMRDQVDQLSLAECESLLLKLARPTWRLEQPETAMDHDIAYARQVNGIATTLMMSGVVQAETQKSLQRLRQTDRRLAVTSSLLRTHLALRAFHLENKQLPTRLDEIVPVYLRSVPHDEFGEGPLIYRPGNNNYLLYSVGPNGADDGGIEPDDGANGDLLLEPAE